MFDAFGYAGMDTATLQAAQDAAIMGSQARVDEAEGLRVTGISEAIDTPDMQEVYFSDGEKVLLTRQQIAAIRMS